jgi:ABC-2 type transport system ATP-binding protein
MMGELPAIEVSSLQKTYRDGLFGRRRVTALKGVSFQVGRGTIFGLLGPNGAGKTTVIKVLLGIVQSSGGSARLLGRPAGDRAGRRRVGYLPENHRIPRHHTALTALEYYGSLSGMSAREIRARRPLLLELVGLGQWGPASVKKFSKGMQQRLGLAQALMHDPELLILDEPTDGVDPVGRSDMRAILQRLKAEGKTIFINSHLLQEVELVCDRVAILVQGELRREGLVADITRRQESEVELTLLGAEPNIRQALSERTITAWTPLAADRFCVRVQMADQVALDRTIDTLRHGAISIAGVSLRRDTLEEAFLDIVTRAEPVLNAPEPVRLEPLP